jgi:nitrile hydratase
MPAAFEIERRPATDSCSPGNEAGLKARALHFVRLVDITPAPHDCRVDGVHDLGGMDGFGPIPIEADEPLFHAPWEGRVWRMRYAVIGRSTTIDRVRSTIEQMPPAEYLASSYYERWLWAIEHLAAEQGMLDSNQQPAEVTLPSPAIPTWTGRFRAGDSVRVRNQVTRGHTRVPRYLRCHVGRIERTAFAWPNPGESARTGTYGAPELVYTVAFPASELFGPTADHTLTADLAESDLEEP